MNITFATANLGKLREVSEILGEGWELLSSRQAGVTEDIPENGQTLLENSVAKAEYLHKATGLDCFADDTGLEVDMLDGAPGVHTARYAGGEGHDFQANMDKLLQDMALKERQAAEKGEPAPPRTARFHCVVTLIQGGETHIFEGTLEGLIANEKAGCGGFGYDPVFIPFAIPDEKGIIVPNTSCLTLAEIPEQDKNAISHRGNALRAMAAFLQEK